ncbi:hypothetical protein RA210_U160038 [Rubrivivax sp. A210]|uniref:hypothetical protein n=1 Tax=Rubrivivax sp. A210 TaxID=2772301 RepID=UPI001919B631|nr:hypothetical protein [Rubrivivax sp. A210]CAD5371653.1 hypothetical protein RA210_U160038 [Rubrivivax sp. A210]
MTGIDLALEFARPVALVQEPARVHVRLTNQGPQQLALPPLREAADSLTLLLVGEDGEVLARARHGERRTTPPLKRAPAPPQWLAGGASLEWELDLAEYFDTGLPGIYRVRGEFQKPAGGPAVTSAPAVLTQQAARCGWFDVARSRAALDITAVLQRCHEGSPATTVLQFLHTGSIGAPDKRVSFELPAEAQPRLSETDFATLDSFAADFARWVVWTQGAELHWLRVTADQPPAPLRTLALPAATAIAGRPVEHRDASISLTLLAADGALTRLELSAAPAITGQRVLGRLAAHDLQVVADDVERRTLVLQAQRASAAVSLQVFGADGAATQHALLAADPGVRRSRILGLQLEVGLPWASAPAALLAQLVEREREGRPVALLRLLSVALRAGVPGATQVNEVEFDRGLLGEGEQLTQVRLARQGRQLFATLATTLGRVLLVAPGLAPSEALLLTPQAAAAALLLVSNRGAVYLFHPTPDQGLKPTLVFEMPRP